MKKVKKCFKIILFLVVINISGFLNVVAATNPYAQTGPYGTNCTWYAWKMANEKAGVTLPGWGNAKNWYNDAKNSGYTVGTAPKANSIIVWGGWTSYGHVGYVESVEGNILHVWDSTGPCIDKEDPEYRECIANGVSEESDKICKANAKRIACEYTISPDIYGITGYIYLDYAPKPVTPSTPQNNPAPSQNVPTTSKEENTTPTVVVKSSNANLSNIELSSGTIQFDKEVLEYSLEVENEVETIIINATSEDQKATIEGIGEYELNIGLNEMKLTVKAEDDTSKEYVIYVIRNEKIEVEIDSGSNNSQIETNDQAEGNNETEEIITKNDNQQIIILILGIFFLILFVFCLTFIFKKKYYNKNVENKK